MVPAAAPALLSCCTHLEVGFKGRVTGPRIETGGRLANPSWPWGERVWRSPRDAPHSPVGASFSKVFCGTMSHSLAASALKHPEEEHRPGKKSATVKPFTRVLGGY